LLKNDSNKFRTASGVFSANKNASRNAFFKRERERERKKEREREREREEKEREREGEKK
jgi:hypothetical protein